MKRIVVALAAVGSVALLAGCGGGSSEVSVKDPGQAALLEAGCTSGQASYTEETWVRERYSCDGQNLYVFNSSDLRDNWSSFANEIGTVEVRRGEKWVLVKA